MRSTFALIGKELEMPYKSIEARNANARIWYVKNREVILAKRKGRNSHQETNRKHFLKATYNMTPEQYEIMLVQQGGVCAICINVCKSGQKLCIDHNHETGQIRALLCKSCNFRVGHIEKLGYKDIVTYLEHFKFEPK